MKAMNKKVLADVLSRPQNCARRGEGGCKGRITIEHAFGRKYEALWNCILLCWHHHLIDLDKDLNKHLAYQQCTDEDLRKYKMYEQMSQEKQWLENKYAEGKNIESI